MNRRDFLRSAGVVSASLAFPKPGRLFAQRATSHSWRAFEVTTRAEVLRPSGRTLVWLPAALISGTPFQRTLANKFSAEGGTAEIVESKADALGIVAASFPAGVRPVLTLTSRVATKNVAVDLAAPGKTPKADRAELEHFLRPTKLLPIDGIVKATATRITSGAKTDLEKARARLFGSWEMNWMAYNFAHDVALPGSSGPPVAFFMYPQAETTDGRLDSLDPDGFKYEITSRETASANG
jgi:mRNA-degrading endonuclease toxin of MazEF toxin-antitoxin module